jgi:hypothetical protein
MSTLDCSVTDVNSHLSSAITRQSIVPETLVRPLERSLIVVAVGDDHHSECEVRDRSETHDARMLNSVHEVGRVDCLVAERDFPMTICILSPAASRASMR